MKKKPAEIKVKQIKKTENKDVKIMCGCGRPDLLEEWNKSEEKKMKEKNKKN